ncbi:hypothetical protein HPB47_010459 [Ixodes persulcatus]|uniref:Uncharacterized protein n=1 Tax=Ixodes persulcatus TaxID=34615 RepID=A0AC60NZ01_IXOPE|nr:hypothetical protein HPB47_010459 [Ixodes persulcatus]
MCRGCVETGPGGALASVVVVRRRRKRPVYAVRRSPPEVPTLYSARPRLFDPETLRVEKTDSFLALSLCRKRVTRASLLRGITKRASSPILFLPALSPPCFFDGGERGGRILGMSGLATMA